MRAFLPAASAAVVLALPALAGAQTADQGSMIYGGAGYAHHDYDGANLGSIQGRVGARVHPNFAVEGEVGLGVNGDKSSSPLGRSSTKLLRQGAVYGVGLLPVSPNTDILARVGYGATDVKTNFASGSVTGSAKDSIKSWNYGVGAQHYFDGQNGLRADYTRADAKRGRDADVWSMGYVRKF
jgi:outer membrane immunogenic protein